MSYKTIHTAAGLAAMASAEATSTPINLTHIAVGDGNGNPVEPTEAQTVLVREVFRATVNRVFQDPSEPTRFTAELVIPATAGGFVMREVGVFDADGTLFVVGNLPDTYKPNISEGAYADTIVRVEFMVTNADVITLMIDPAVAVASQAWVINNITACFLLPGGTTGQILRKASNGCGDTEWADPTEAEVVVNSIEETQTLAAAQTVVDWAVVNNGGLSVYVEGVRLRADEFTKHPTIPTRITLATSYPAGTKIVGAQNEPAGSFADALERAQNLDDLPSKATARTNLDVHSKAESNAAGQPGDIKHTARSTAPTGWLKANGAAISRTAYADLFAAIGTTFGAGDGFNTFNLPDLRGEFVRGWDDGRGVDSGRTMGSAQKGTLTGWDQGDDSLFTLSTAASGSASQGAIGADAYSTTEYPGIKIRGVNDASWQPLPGGSGGSGATTGGYTGVARPRNIALLACIKF